MRLFRSRGRPPRFPLPLALPRPFSSPCARRGWDPPAVPKGRRAIRINFMARGWGNGGLNPSALQSALCLPACRPGRACPPSCRAFVSCVRFPPPACALCADIPPFPRRRRAPSSPTPVNIRGVRAAKKRHKNRRARAPQFSCLTKIFFCLFLSQKSPVALCIFSVPNVQKTCQNKNGCG